MPWSNLASKLLVPAVLALLAGLQNTSPTSDVPGSSPPAAEKPLLIMIDPAHGGTDPGALLSASTPEKDITLNMARRLKQELTARGIPSQLVRESDLTLTADQRAAMTNSADPTLYIALHASSLGNGMRVFTALLPTSGSDKGSFLGWDRAQSACTVPGKGQKVAPGVVPSPSAKPESNVREYV